MSFDDIPEDRVESYPCQFCNNGNIIRVGDHWECDCCDFKTEPINK